MNRRLALAAAPLALLAACSSGGGSSAPSTVTQTVTTSSSSTLPDTPLNSLRTELDKLGIPCVTDADWTPATSGEYEGADTAGMCGENKAVITTHAGNRGEGPNFLALRSKALDFAAGGGDATTVVNADGWSVLTDKATAQKLVDAHPGAERFDG